LLEQQGDQIGRISLLGPLFFGQFLLKTKDCANFWASFFPSEKNCALILAKKGWATLWAIFSLTHLVTLLSSK
jgi:hypothetical protein